VVVAIGLVVALAGAGLAGLYASDSPDGLERVAIDHGLTEAEKPHQLDGSPFAGYEAGGRLSGALSSGLAGVVGIGVTFALAGGATWLLRRRRPPDGAADTASFRPGARPDDHAAGRSVPAGRSGADQASAKSGHVRAETPADGSG
jgi:hypothetical protein